MEKYTIALIMIFIISLIVLIEVPVITPGYRTINDQLLKNSGTKDFHSGEGLPLFNFSVPSSGDYVLFLLMNTSSGNVSIVNFSNRPISLYHAPMPPIDLPPGQYSVIYYPSTNGTVAYNYAVVPAGLAREETSVQSALTLASEVGIAGSGILLLLQGLSSILRRK